MEIRLTDAVNFVRIFVGVANVEDAIAHEVLLDFGVSALGNPNHSILPSIQLPNPILAIVPLDAESPMSERRKFFLLELLFLFLRPRPRRRNPLRNLMFVGQ